MKIPRGKGYDVPLFLRESMKLVELLKEDPNRTFFHGRNLLLFPISPIRHLPYIYFFIKLAK